MAGGLIATMSVPVFTGLFPERKNGYLVMAVFGSLACVPYFLIIAIIKERFSNVAQSQLNILTGFLYTWRNRAFHYAAGICLTAWVTVSLASAPFQYYVTDVMKMQGGTISSLGCPRLGR